MRGWEGGVFQNGLFQDEALLQERKEERAARVHGRRYAGCLRLLSQKVKKKAEQAVRSRDR
jgi:hypothetical protein